MALVVAAAVASTHSGFGSFVQGPSVLAFRVCIRVFRALLATAGFFAGLLRGSVPACTAEAALLAAAASSARIDLTALRPGLASTSTS